METPKFNNPAVDRLVAEFIKIGSNELRTAILTYALTRDRMSPDEKKEFAQLSLRMAAVLIISVVRKQGATGVDSSHLILAANETMGMGIANTSRFISELVSKNILSRCGPGEMFIIDPKSLKTENADDKASETR